MGNHCSWVTAVSQERLALQCQDLWVCSLRRLEQPESSWWLMGDGAGGDAVSGRAGLCRCATCSSLGGNETEEKSEVQAIIESTPELDMDKDLSGYKGSR